MSSSAVLQARDFVDNHETSSFIGHGRSLPNRPVSLEHRGAVLTDCFPGHNTEAFYNHIRTRLPTSVPEGAHEWAAVLRRSALGGSFEEQTRNAMLAMKASGRMKLVWGEEHYPYLKPEQRTLDCLDILGQRQRGDILIIPIRRGVRLAQDYLPGEFDLGSFEGACIDVGDTEVIRRHNTPSVEFRGEIYNPGSGPDSARTPCFEVESTGHPHVQYCMATNRLKKERPNRRYCVTGFLF